MAKNRQALAYAMPKQGSFFQKERIKSDQQQP